MAVSRKALFRRCWEAADKMRGGMDPSEYKNYILPLIFMRAVSLAYPEDDGQVRFPPGTRYADLMELCGTQGVGDMLNKRLEAFLDANPTHDLGEVLRVDYNSAAKLGSPGEIRDKVSRLISLFGSVDFSARDSTEAADLFGDIYEYMMGKFAVDSGKSKGQFYTPIGVSVALARLCGLRSLERSGQSIYDPTCGSGSALLRAREEAIHGLRLRGRLTSRFSPAIYGQESDGVTAALARMNMIIHRDVTAEIHKGNTLTNPRLEGGEIAQYDAVVGNPPFSQKGVDMPDEDPHGRFVYGRPPKKNADFAFLQHIVASLRPGGRAAVVFPHGVLFRGGAEGAIRERMLRDGVFLGVVGLPSNVFYGTGIPACIVLLRKPRGGEGTSGPLMFIDASRHFREQDGKSVVREVDVYRMVTAYEGREDRPGYSRLVDFAEVERNGFNLNISRYVAPPDDGFAPDLRAHLFGGVPDRHLDRFAPFWDGIAGLRSALFESLRPGYSRARHAPDDMAEVIEANPGVEEHRAALRRAAEVWWVAARARLDGLGAETNLREVGEELAEGIHAAFGRVAPADPWAAFQRVFEVWGSRVEDAARIVMSEGWDASNAEVLTGAAIVDHRLPERRDALGALHAEAEAAKAGLEEMAGEVDEGGLLSEAVGDKGIPVPALARKRLESGDAEADEAEALGRWLSLHARLSELRPAIKAAEAALAKAVHTERERMTEADTRAAVLDGSWREAMLSALDEVVQDGLSRFAADISNLARDYARSVPETVERVDELERRVDGHLRRMGVIP